MIIGYNFLLQNRSSERFYDDFFAEVPYSDNISVGAATVMLSLIPRKMMI